MSHKITAKNITKKVYKKLKKQNLLDKSQLEAYKVKSKSSHTPLKPDQETAVNKQVSQFTKAPDLSTLSIAVPGSILENAQTLELRSYLAGQIARAASVYRVDEIVVFDDLGVIGAHEDCSETFDGVPSRHCCIQMARLLQYLECPQYLRKHLFGMHNDLTRVGVISPLDAPHHLRQDEECAFREGVVLKRPGKGSYVNVGLRKECYVDQQLCPGIRVTVALDPQQDPSRKNLHGRVASPAHAKQHVGYWGYRVRIANTLGEVFTRAPYTEGYDLSLGTSDKGVEVDSLPPCDYHHVLLVFGGLYGLEQALQDDEDQITNDPSLLFDHYVNTCPGQGSRTIRTEEAVLITLAELRRVLRPKEKVSLERLFSSSRAPSATKHAANHTTGSSSHSTDRDC